MSQRWNPNAPEILGLEWWPVFGVERAVNSGNTRVQRLRSSEAESISHIATEVIGDRSRREPLHTLLEVFEQGREFPTGDDRIDVVDLAPNAHGSSIGQWTTNTGSTSNLWAAINQPVVFPPGAGFTAIRTRSSLNAAHFHVNASLFDTGGTLAGTRICRVSIAAVFSLDPNPDNGRRPVQFELRHKPSGVVYSSPGNSWWAHFYGQIEIVDCGEINPHTRYPWLPSDIAEFDGGDWEVRVLGQGTTRMGVRVISMALRVHFLPEENREAVGVISRNDLQYGSDGFAHGGAKTQRLISLPTGSNNWNKPASGDFLFAWRRANDILVNRSQPRATDLHTVWAYQDLGSRGEPPGVSQPPFEGDRLRTLSIDEFGLPIEAWQPGPRRAIAPMVLQSEGANLGEGVAPVSVGDALVASSLEASAAGLLVCNWSVNFAGTITPPGGMTAGANLQSGSTTTERHATQAIAAAGPTGTRTATTGLSINQRYSATSVALAGSITIQQTLTGVETSTPGQVTLNTAGGTTAGWHLLAIHTVSEDPNNAIGQPSGDGWTLLADSVFTDWSASRTRVWIKEVESSGAQSVSFPYTRSHGGVFGRLLVLSGVVGGMTQVSADSQPYRFNLRDLGHADAVMRNGDVRSQLITAPASEDYLGIKWVVVPPSAGNATLTARVVRHSDETQIGGTFTITASQARQLARISGSPARFVSGILSSGASLVADTAYHIRLTASGTGDWLTFTPNARLDGASKFGYSPQDSLWRGSGGSKAQVPTKDLAITLIRQPDPPDDFTAAIVDVSGQFADMPSGVHANTVSSVDGVRLSWTATTFGATFARYELEWQEVDEDSEWERVAVIEDESVDSFDHLISRRGVQVRYRLRVVLTDSAFSQWVTSLFVTPQATKQEILFISDHRPELSVAYLRSRGEEHEFPAADEDVEIAIEGSPNVVVFKPPRATDRGRNVRLRIHTHFGPSAPSPGGIAAFDALYDLVRSDDIPYIVILDHLGNRIFGHVRLESASVAHIGNSYEVEVTLIPTHNEPIPVTIEAE